MDFEIFRNLYPCDSLSSCEVSDLPDNAFFDTGVEAGNEEDYVRLGPCYHLQQGVDEIFIITRSEHGKDGLELITCVRDFDRHGAMVGYGSLTLVHNEHDFFKNRPFVENTYTDHWARKRGLGTRRLQVMNALALASHGYPLHSSRQITPGAISLWDHLVEQGEAIKFTQYKDYERYRFKQPSE